MSETATETPDPTHCDRCGASLERGWSERWSGKKRIHAWCIPCADRERLEEYAKTGELTTQVMVRASIDNALREYGKGVTCPSERNLLARAWASTEAIQRAAKDFERAVWFGGLAEQVRAAEHRGWRAGFQIAGEKHDVLVWSCAGRVVFTIEPADESRHISVICAEDGGESTMGIKGIMATEQQAIAMLAGACVAFASGMQFERDDKVGMF
ncbi:hypothetical protein [Sorangium sp. So ce388]|uniref:hypothetical protein n=1 Tax=Sorangium sp. So ce388 TaxID=3133309 RepID=UPI003F5C2772